MAGWKYEHAYESSQKYKEGKFIIELAHMIKVQYSNYMMKVDTSTVTTVTAHIIKVDTSTVTTLTAHMMKVNTSTVITVTA